MAQYARPDSDVSAGSWTASSGSDLYAMVDETSYSDSDYVSAIRADTTCELGLSNVTDPVSSSGHVLRVRHLKTGAGVMGTCAAILKQGATTIATMSCTPGSVQTQELTLSGAEADAITDYNDLRVALTADWTSGVVTGWQVTWVELETPDAPAAGGQPLMTRATSVPYMRQWQPGRR